MILKYELSSIHAMLTLHTAYILLLLFDFAERESSVEKKTKRIIFQTKKLRKKMNVRDFEC